MEDRLKPGGRGTGSCPRAGRFLYWEDLSPAERETLARHATECPVCGPLHERLSEATAWLERRLEAALGSSPCPSSDELFDYGGGRGTAELAAERRVELDEHLSRCSECRSFVATLSASPPIPSPLVFDDEEPAADVERTPVLAVSATRLASRRWQGWTAAALLLLTCATTFAVWKRTAAGPDTPHAGRTFEFPESPLLRGESESALWFPRGRVLQAADGAELPWMSDTFEVDPIENATLYRFIVRENPGGAFGIGPERFRVESTEPRVAAGDPWRELGVGHYTWQAWARVHGIEQRLGELDFEIVHDPPTAQRVRVVLSGYDAGPERTFALFSALFDAGYACDARALARDLPESAERDRFLERQTQR